MKAKRKDVKAVAPVKIKLTLSKKEAEFLYELFNHRGVTRACREIGGFDPKIIRTCLSEYESSPVFHQISKSLADYYQRSAPWRTPQ